MGRAGGSANPVEKHSRYDDIITSSIEVFSRTNYENATTAMLACEAGVAEGTIYKYFPSKKELFLECCRYVEKLLEERYRAVYEDCGDRPLEYLKRVAKSYVDFVFENPSMSKFLAFMLNGSFDSDLRREMERFITLHVDTTERMIRKAIDSGELKGDLDPGSVAWMFVGGYFTIILMAELGAKEARDPEFLEKSLFEILK